MNQGDWNRVQGMLSASSAEERDNPGFVARALDAIWYAATSNKFVHVDTVAAIFPERPLHPNAWGSIWTKAVKLGWIERTSFSHKAAIDAGKHAHIYPVYVSRIANA